MKHLAHLLTALEEYRQYSDAVERRQLPAVLTGLSGVHKALMVYASCVNLESPALILCPDEASATRLCEDMNALFEENRALVYPARDFTFRDADSVSHEYEQARLSVLGKILSGECDIVLCSVEALTQLTIPPKRYRELAFEIAAGGEYRLEALLERLVGAGYVRADQVDGMCQFSLRGGILDVFPPDSPNPVRIEFWGDEVDTLSYFDVGTQRRLDPVERVSVSPAREVLFSSPDELMEKLAELRALQRGKAGKLAKVNIDRDMQRLRDHLTFASFDRFLPLAYGEGATLLDYLPDALLFVSDYIKIRETQKNLLWQRDEDLKMLFEEGVLYRGLDRYDLERGQLQQALCSRRTVVLETFARSLPELPVKTLLNFDAIQLSGWSGEIKYLLDDLRGFLDRKYCVAVLAGTRRAAQALVSDLRKEGFPVDFAEDVKSIVFGRVYVLEGGLSGGFDLPGIRFALITQSAARRVGETKRKRRPKAPGDKISSLADLTPGDYVVHISHGIGVFEGIHKMDIHGVVKDYIKIRYAGADTLYVPVTQLDLVSKYIGPRENGSIRLNKLNSTDWQKTRSRVKKAVDDMADELIKLYAKRMQVKGYAFSPDSEWQREFEEHFPYEETDDQLRCISELKGDMEGTVPMDRLLCGDVGFGKTEVALRGAFKCVLDGKQCAILVPTTILAWQHYNTILARMEGFPVNVEILSRFKSPKQQQEIVKKLARGEIDIIVGTHRLIQKDVRFKDLGLVIIDEEQRFGVAHKERFKELRSTVDVLTLSATPIPRTLSMAMSGMRDMSVIEEAPSDRHPVQTYVLEYNRGVIGDAIKRELRRGGQVFYLHNRVETIDRCALRIQEMVPDARIMVAHGKMGEEDLSSIWQRLLDHEIDILVCTTIIETGVDVPNCNTLIIEDADRMGLSQLYQLRGRVGRSNRRAFAYFTFQNGKVLTDVAAKRLSAIREFTSFGSGFRIAMRDLEIRGAGNILGAQQHGHMEAVGYEMYLKLLSDAVAQKRGDAPETPVEECLIDIRIEAHIPPRYIENQTQRIEVYKRIAGIRSYEDSLDVMDELIDRFGEPPASVKGLIDVSLMRGTAARMGITEITQKNNEIVFSLSRVDMNMIGALVSELRGRVLLSAGQKPYLTVKIADKQTPLAAMRQILSAMDMASAPRESE
ncbi:transcription-repair coupling factor [Zongyangia hominis]|uniref:Transcription-repair-coupling factor n=1 Tax=Zongyangia hominis TaxID=2763677 RepID=A0A926ECI6_9FIRM|nr:transcription-repair coupling factor [Zongyangia hominis]MBC8570565.1 transcription-repair coupling factor [Zongyangia hominis]